jgi:glycosyltransferase involved in cell wall biosynthesis
MPQSQSDLNAIIAPARSRLTLFRPHEAEDRVLIIVPAYNEAGALPALMQSLRTVCPTCDVVVIDDGSTDGTRQSVNDMARVVSLPCNLGIGAAMQTGLQIALQENYDYAVQVDGDGQHPPQELEQLLRVARQSGCDLVVGSRFRMAEGFKSTAIRRIGIRLFAWMLSYICETRITDPTSGFRVMNRRAITILARRYSEDFPEVEAIVQVYRAGLRITEAPVQMTERVTGNSSIGSVKSLLYMLKVPMAIFMSLLRKPEEA